MLKNTYMYIGLLIVSLVVILEIGKSIRIHQLNELKIDAIGSYEKNSKIEYLKVLDSTNIIY
jgi:hypothetical protein